MATTRSSAPLLAKSGGPALSLFYRARFAKRGAWYNSFHQLAQSGIPWVILGHSERRSLFHETNEEVGTKVAAALSEKLSVIACVGETLEQREAGETMSVIKEQLEGIKAEISDWS